MGAISTVGALGPLRAPMELRYLRRRDLLGLRVISASWPPVRCRGSRSFVTAVSFSDCASAPKIRRSRRGSGLFSSPVYAERA